MSFSAGTLAEWFFIRLGFVDSLACETIEGEFPSWDGGACQLLTSEIQIKAWLNGYLIAVSGNVA